MTNQELQALATQYKEYKRLADEAQELANSVADQIKQAINESGESKVIAGQYKINYSEIKRTDIDKKRLELEQPEIYTEYQKITSYKRLLVS